MCNSVQDHISHVSSLDTIRKLSRSSTTVNIYTGNAFLKENEQVHHFNPSIDKKEDQICFKC